jgi:hypothetical protein
MYKVVNNTAFIWLSSLTVNNFTYEKEYQSIPTLS